MDPLPGLRLINMWPGLENVPREKYWPSELTSRTHFPPPRTWVHLVLVAFIALMPWKIWKSWPAVAQFALSKHENSLTSHYFIFFINYVFSSFLYETGLVVIYCIFRVSLQTLTEKRSIHFLLSTDFVYFLLTQPDSLVLLVGHQLFSGIPTLPYVYIFRRRDGWMVSST